MQNAALANVGSPLEALARDMLTRQPGDRIATVVEYQDLLGVGSGTVQARLQVLAGVGAIELRARGHQGTVLVSRNLSVLWSLARLGPVSGVLPLPEAVEPVSLAAILRRACQRQSIPLELLYLHGAARRIELVRARAAHFTVLSRPAAELATGAESDTWLTLDFGPESYHRQDSMVVLVGPRAAASGSISSVGIDPESHDHTLLTRLEFAADEGYVHLPFPHARLPKAVADGLIDAAVWLRTPLAIPPQSVGIMIRPLDMPEAVRANEALGHAVLLARTDDQEVANVLREIDLSGAAGVQEEILRSDVLPLY